MFLQANKGHTEMRLVVIADAHFSPTTPPSYKVDYWEHTLQTIKQVLDFVVNNEVDAVLWPGDIFHKKSPAANPHHFVTKVIKIFRFLVENGVENLLIAGNHDVKYGSLKGLEGQPLDSLIEAGLARLLDREPVILEKMDPRKGRTYLTVKVDGRSYDHGRADEYLKMKKEDCHYLVGLGHFWYGPTSGEFLGEPMYGPDTLGKSEIDVHVIGHHHEDQGVLNQDGKWYVCQGSINRTGAHAGDLKRRPAAAYIVIDKTEGVKVTILRPKVLGAADIFDQEKHQQVIQEKKEMEEFIQSLHGVEFTTQDPHQLIQEQPVIQEIKLRAESYLERAEAEGK